MVTDPTARLRIATAGWAIPRAIADRFPPEGSGLQRYGAVLDAVEINSTFYKSHRAGTYERWRASTPDDFRFAVKLARQITHAVKLIDSEGLLTAFVAEVGQLGDKLGPLLVQLPPSLAFSASDHERFLALLRRLWHGRVAFEPRHESWFGPEAEALLHSYEVARVAADPPRHPGGERPGGWDGFIYRRLHGSPRTYYTSYDDGRLAILADDLSVERAPETWCVFDNTASGAAASDALLLRDRLTT